MEDLSAALTVEADASAAEPAVVDKAPDKVESKPAKAEAKPEAKSEKTPEETLDADLKKVFRKNNPLREAGKFAKDEQASSEKPEAKSEAKPDAKAEAKPETKVEEPAAEAPKPVKAPDAWPAEMKAKFAALPPEVQQFVQQRELEAHKQIATLGMTAKQVEQFRPFNDVLNEHKDYLRGVGQDTPQFMSNLLRAAKNLDTNPKATIKQLADAYNVDLGELYDPFQPAPDPEVSELKQTVAELQRRLQGEDQRRAAYAQQQRESRVSEYEKVLDEFTQTKPDFAEIEQDFHVQLRAIHARNPSGDLKTKLSDAYDAASWANPKTRAAQIQEQNRQAEITRIEEAKKAANAARAAGSINVHGSHQISAAGDMDSDLRSIWRKNQRA